MPCTRPLNGYRGPDGITFRVREGYFDAHITVPCGQCLSCRLRRKRNWAIRAMHELQMNGGVGCFLTLTYNDANLPVDLSLDVREWQLFAKRVRAKYGSFKFIHCGEYGPSTLRPHYHACIFGLDFKGDSVPIKRGESEFPLRISSSLSELWPKGFHTIGDVTFESASYVAGYTVKKVTGKRAEKHYERVDPGTGEVWSVRPEYATMSRRPGLGASFYERFKSDIYPDDFVVMKGQKFPVPEYYANRLKAEEPEVSAKLKDAKRLFVVSRAEERTPERLFDIEKCREAHASLYSRGVL